MTYPIPQRLGNKPKTPETGCVDATRGGADAPLPCLSNNNCSPSGEQGFKGEEGRSERLKSYQYKSIFGVRKNVAGWERKYPIEKLGFLTLTFKENIKDKHEAAKRYKRFRNYFEEIGIGEVLIKATEIQKRGALHFHCITVMRGDVRSGFDWEAYGQARHMGSLIYGTGGFRKAPDTLKQAYGHQTKVYGASATPFLRASWKALRKAAKIAGFGRCELAPVKSTKALGQYVGKYLTKSLTVQNEAYKGMRKINYSRTAPRLSLIHI